MYIGVNTATQLGVFDLFVALVWFSEVSWFIIGLRWLIKAWGWIPICFGRFGDLLNFIKVVVSFVYVELIRQYIQEPPNSVSFFTYVHISNKTIFPVLFFGTYVFFGWGYQHYINF